MPVVTWLNRRIGTALLFVILQAVALIARVLPAD
jgi:hypothetical protein